MAQSEPRIEVCTRERDGCQVAVVEPPQDTMASRAIGANLSLEAIYQGNGR